MKLIDRYIEAVSAHLPEKIREDVKTELKSNILDMLSDNPGDEEIRQILESLGSPSELALEYSPARRYLIGPAIYDRYLSTLKLVLSIVAVCFIIIIGMKWIFTDSITDNIVVNISSYMMETIASVTEGLLQSAFWVTLIFVIMERKHVVDGQSIFQSRAWRIEDLPKSAVSKKNQISRGQTIVGICFTLFFTFLIYAQPIAIGVIVSNGSNTQSISLFNNERLSQYLLFILATAILSLGLSIWKLLTERWTFSLALGNALLNTFVCILVIVMVNDTALWNQALQDFYHSYLLTKNTSAYTIGLDNGVIIGLILFVGISIWDSIHSFLKCR